MDESMEKDLIVLDSSVLIDYFRKTKKETTFFVKLTDKYSSFAVSVITQFEIYVGSNETNKLFWDKFFSDFKILALDENCIMTAIEINEELKKKNRQIAFPDLLIAATAKANNLPLATLNQKHFSRINRLELITSGKESPNQITD
jgi:tRNA(fMet)-specific endonuclease VapC